jgi:hypothetical protein
MKTACGNISIKFVTTPISIAQVNRVLYRTHINAGNSHNTATSFSKSAVLRG